MKVRAPKEQLSPLGDRVYPKHRKMLREIAGALSIRSAEALRRSIEETHAHYVAAA